MVNDTARPVFDSSGRSSARRLAKQGSDRLAEAARTILARPSDYARVRTYGQTLNVQAAQLRAEGRAKIYQERASDAQANRRELLKDLAPVT